MYLTQRTAAAGLFLVVPVIFWPFQPWSGVAATVVFLAAVAGRDWLSAPKASDLQTAVTCPAVVLARRSVPVAVRVHNPARKTLTVHLHLEVLPSLNSSLLRQTLRLEPGEWGEAQGSLTPQSRGRFSVGPVTIRTEGPWGLAGRQTTIPVSQQLKVYPVLAARRQVELKLRQARLLQTGRRSSTIRGGGTEFDSLREYHPDDEFRRINWRATARAPRPISNIFREERNQRVFLVLDAGRTMSTSIGGFSRLEYAIDAGAALAELAAGMGDHVGMVAFGAKVLQTVGPRSGKEQVRRIINGLFDLFPTLQAANYRYAFAWLLSRFSRRALLVVLTELNEVAAIESLLDAMPMLTSKHLVIVGAVVDPVVEELARAVPASSQEAYVKAAAEASLLAREEAALKLRSMGATVVDRKPGELAGRLADEYLRIKAFGRL